jgi:hypothetical protein
LDAYSLRPNESLSDIISFASVAAGCTSPWEDWVEAPPVSRATWTGGEFSSSSRALHEKALMGPLVKPCIGRPRVSGTKSRGDLKAQQRTCNQDCEKSRHSSAGAEFLSEKGGC